MISLDRVISDTRSLIGIDSQNPGPLEGKCAEWVGNRLTEAGLDVERMPVAEGRDNIVARVPGEGTAPRLVLLGHMDTVPVGEGWTFPPLGGAIADGRLYGRGACDMKAGLALSINLLDALAAGGRPPAGDVLLVATVDEEAPDMAGAHRLVESGLLRPDDQVLALEPTGMRLRIAQMGLRWLTLRVRGRMAHAGRAHLGIDANHLMAKIVDRLKTVFAALPYEDELLGRPRFTCGTFHGGVATNVVPPSCEAGLDVRIVPPMTPAHAQAIVDRVAAAVIAEYPGAEYVIEPLGAERPPVRASDDAPVVRGLRAAHLEHTGRAVPVGGADGHEAYTDASMVAALTGSTSCTVFGPGATDQAHTADEYVPLADLDLGARMLGTLVNNWGETAL
ncbi:succinyl-diaminopimelate desuccinylase [Actinocorallia herbida]|uniref:Succinyl-diaminopimelate desuccinylase n=1 Tax=Actinocorallia herbida TaxID=58109 RepID=A0A3N1D143_9ACTN|nr:M20 family metallopeptidase [Actinocorallia herbida]ROO87239.1 succinyl-diaminopimelate desuccinylase [Actinocorallia herbida]